MRTAAGTEWATLRDRFAASDPGLLRLTAGLRVAASIALALAVLAALDVPPPQLVTGAVAAMVATFSIREKERPQQAVTLALGLVAALVSLSVGTVLAAWIPVVGDLFFVALIFTAAYSRRFGDRGFALGLICFQTYFLSLFVHARPADLPGLYVVITIGFACSGVVRFAVVPEPPERVLERLREAFRARLAQLVSAQLALLDAGPDQAEKALEQVRSRTARLHETALMIQSRLAEGTPDEATASLVQRRIADAEIAAERLGLLVLTARSTGSADTLTMHLPGAPLPAGGRTPVQEEATTLLRRDLEALETLVLSPVTGPVRSAPAELRNRLLGYRDEENLPQASPAVRDVFRGIGEAARAVLGLRMALGGEPDESQDSASTARSREELDAENAAIAGSEEEEPEAKATGLDRPTTRAAAQVTVGSAMAIVAGELLSAQRYYWAVLACWIVFLNTASTGEILVKGYRRVLGTVLGAVAGIVLAGLVQNRTWVAFGLLLVLIFLMHYTARVSYTLLSFFVTAMLGLLYTLLNTYSLQVLVLRIEETLIGAVCGVVAAAVVLPVQTARHTAELLVKVLNRLTDVTEAAVGQLSGGPAVELLDRARDLDQALSDLRASTKPLTHPITPQRGRRDTARYVVALLETCAYHARTLAATAELLPSNPAIAADPRLRLAGRRIAHNLDAISAHVAGSKDAPEVETGPSIASLLGDTGGAPRYGQITDRVLRHLERLDEAVTGLARPLRVPARAGTGTGAGAPS